MLLREKSRITVLSYLFVLSSGLTPASSWAQAELKSYFTGNAVAKPEAIEKIVRMSIADVLNGRFSGANLSFATQKVDESIAIPDPSTNLRDILNVLGIQNQVRINLSPIQADFTLPNSALNITIKKIKPNRFQVCAKWVITKLTAASPKLALQVPKGVFERGFEIVSSPVQIGLAPKSKPITIDLDLITELTDQGTKIRLVDFKTNINEKSASGPQFFIKLGKLTVEGRPLEIEIMSNGQRLVADEATIRSEFQTMEASLIQNIRQNLQAVIEKHFQSISESIEKAPPIKVAVDSTELMHKVEDKPELKKLLNGVSVDFFVSYLQYIEKYKLFTAQVSSTVCIDKLCLLDLAKKNLVTIDDLKSVSTTNDDIAVLVYESWLQNLIHSDLFQKRIREILKSSDLAGINLSKDGVKIHLNPTTNSVVLVANVEIDIKKTSKSGSALGQRMRRRFGDWMESWFGSGKLVKIPVEVTGKIKDIRVDADGVSNLVIATELPFKDGKLKNTYKYPSNAADMTSMVRNDLFDSLKEELASAIPAELVIPLGKSIDIKHFSFKLKHVTITQNRGLLVTAELKK